MPKINHDTHTDIKFKMCQNFLERGRCSYGPSCAFAHNPDEIIRMEDIIKNISKTNKRKIKYLNTKEEFNKLKLLLRNEIHERNRLTGEVDILLVHNHKLKDNVNYLEDKLNKLKNLENDVNYFRDKLKNSNDSLIKTKHELNHYKCENEELLAKNKRMQDTMIKLFELYNNNKYQELEDVLLNEPTIKQNNVINKPLNNYCDIFMKSLNRNI